eukprot:CAMPEP_0180600016 /NCGR_PEP_ID=MMETSP1037_2-20121125/23698_1 /TAXON_ID=632150 /ORGANISM="Azadinium spinosum, Strain 3D9" /LENGTH=89 /DNA_ID=CAMNT_0022618713 /DNA_START=21 /DNA_END=290 /DNA_ORIENTATION=+
MKFALSLVEGEHVQVLRASHDSLTRWLLLMLVTLCIADLILAALTDALLELVHVDHRAVDMLLRTLFEDTLRGLDAAHHDEGKARRAQP